MVLNYEIRQKPIDEDRFQAAEKYVGRSHSVKLKSGNLAYYRVYFWINADKPEHIKLVSKAIYRIPELGQLEVQKNKNDENIEYGFELATYKKKFTLYCSLYYGVIESERYEYQVDLNSEKSALETVR